MRKSYLLLCLAALPMITAARSLTPEEALMRASHGAMKAPGKAEVAAYELTYSELKDGAPKVYVFNAKDSDGFVVLSADDVATPVLGYCDSGRFDENNLPDNFRWWLSQYAEEIAAYTPAEGTIHYAPSRLPDIAPLLTSKWNQDSPFNDQCPIISGQHAVTGCVATALAQVMYYYQWPVQPTGTHSYTHSSLGEISLDYSTITFDWANMTPVYDSSSTEAQKAAVATLMYACGVGVNMNYGVYASGAASIWMQRALVDNFGYDSGIRLLYRDFFNPQDWEQIVYDELVEGRPVLYAGQSSGGGHQFVCDGYSDGYYHINWGWGGSSDGYFALSALDPSVQGIGGSTSGYNSGQNILVGVQKPQATPSSSVVMYTEGALRPENWSYKKNSYINFKTLEPYTNSKSFFYNLSSWAITVNLAVKFTANDGTVYYRKDTSDVTLSVGQGISGFMVYLNDIPAGSYAVTPAYYDTTTGTYGDIYDYINFHCPLYAVVDDTNVTFNLDQTTLTPPTVAGFKLVSPLYTGRKVKASATITSTEDRVMGVTLAFFEKGTSTLVANGAEMVLNMKANEPLYFEYISALAGSANLTADTQYDMVLINEYGSIVCGPVEVTCQNAPTETATYTFDELYVTNPGAQAPKDDIRVHGKITCTAGYIDKSFKIMLFKSTGSSNLKNIDTPTIFAQAGESSEFDLSFSYDGDEGEYVLYFIDGGINYYPEASFTLVAPTPEDKTNVLSFDPKNAFSASTPVNTVAKDGSGAWRANQIDIMDAYQFANPVDFEASKINYTRTFTHTNWSALYLPFSLTASEWSGYASEVIRYTGDTTVGGETVLTFETVSAGATLEANHPYIFKPKATGEKVLTVNNKTLCATPADDYCVDYGTNYDLYGVYEVKDDMMTSGAYALKNGNFHPANSDAALLKPFRVYLLPKGVLFAPSMLKLVVDGDTDALNAIVNDECDDNVLYDLQGRKVDHPVPGFYILNGQKIYIKK